MRARVVMRQTGVYSDAVRRLDDPAATDTIAASQGIHLVLERSFLGGESAIMVPHTDDGRVLFAIPWSGRVLIGTTDTPVSDIAAEPRPLAAEIDFLLRHAGRYLTRHPGRDDILSVFAGLRPLMQDCVHGDTASLPREPAVLVSKYGLVTVRGEEISLTPTEYDILRLMVPHAGKVLTHGQILKQIWGLAYLEQPHVLRVNISNLRRKIETDPSRPRHIITEPGVGYRLTC